MSDVTCRGSFALGTACGKCSRCRREIESYNAMKAVRDKLNTPSSAISRIEELERMLGLADDQCREWRHHCKAAEAKLAKAVDALDEAVYLLRPDEKDMMRKAGVYRIVTTLAELKGQNDEC